MGHNIIGTVITTLQISVVVVVGMIQTCTLVGTQSACPMFSIHSLSHTGSLCLLCCNGYITIYTGPCMYQLPNLKTLTGAGGCTLNNYCDIGSSLPDCAIRLKT